MVVLCPNFDMFDPTSVACYQSISIIRSHRCISLTEILLEVKGMYIVIMTYP